MVPTQTRASCYSRKKITEELRGEGKQRMAKQQQPLPPAPSASPHPVQFPLSEEMKQNTSIERTGLFLRIIKLQFLVKGVENELLFQVSEALRQNINILVP